MTTRRTYTILLSLALLLVSVSLIGQTQPFDLLIQGGQVLDGSGNPWFRGDVAIRGDRIAAVGRLAGAKATRVIDATGLIVAPGCIDMHTHSDTALLADGLAQSKVRQGVTLEVLGESTSVAPRDGLTDEPEPGGPTLDWTTFTGYFQRLTKQGVSVNVASYGSAAQVRRVVMGYTGRAATGDELEKMKKLVARSMEEGAIGLVARFETGGPTHPDEIIALAKVASSYGGIYASHTGRQGSQQEKEYAFAIRVAEEANIPVHIFHVKIIEESHWGTIEKYLNQIEAARARGLEVTGNQYPYTAMSHGWANFFPVWAREGGPEKFGAMLQDAAIREKIKKDPEFLLLSKEHGGWEGIAMARAFKPENQKYVGMRVQDIAKARGDKDPADTVLALMASENGRITGVFHNQSENDLQAAMKRPWISFGSDGTSLTLDAPGAPHPRNYGTHARVLGRYARELNVLTLEDAIRKMTALPAQILGLHDRGVIREGYAADIVVFDKGTVGEGNSFEKPKGYATGVPYVVVNGVLVIDKGQHTGAKPGRPVLGAGARSATH
jgi:N-acyl-D-aspartate/D-glutamate deacylase